MEQIDWEAMRTGGTPACWEALRRLESGLRQLQERTETLTLMVPVQQRLEPWWFKRYVELYRMLVEAGMPPEAEGEEVAKWLSGRSPDGAKSANGCGDATASGSGCVEETGLQHVSFRCNGSVHVDPPKPEPEPVASVAVSDDRCPDCGQDC